MSCCVTDHIWYDSLIHWRQDECPPVRSRYFEIHFVKWKLLNFRWYFIEMCSLGFNWQYVFIGSDNGLTPNSRQAIIWANVSLVYCHMYAAVGLNGLTSIKPRVKVIHAWDDPTSPKSNASFINDPPIPSSYFTSADFSQWNGRIITITNVMGTDGRTEG